MNPKALAKRRRLKAKQAALDEDNRLRAKMGKKPRKLPDQGKYCIHDVHEDLVCEHCNEDFAEGWIRERRVFTRDGLKYRRARLIGNCIRCWKPRGDSPYTSFCLPCWQKRIRFVRRVRGFNPWRPGHKGRPPKIRTE